MLGLLHLLLLLGLNLLTNCNKLRQLLLLLLLYKHLELFNLFMERLLLSISQTLLFLHLLVWIRMVIWMVEYWDRLRPFTLEFFCVLVLQFVHFVPQVASFAVAKVNHRLQWRSNRSYGHWHWARSCRLLFFDFYKLFFCYNGLWFKELNIELFAIICLLYSMRVKGLNWSHWVDNRRVILSLTVW